MKVTVTSIELKGPFHFFLLSAKALKVVRQLKTTKQLAFKKKGFWTKHYTMTLWANDEDLKEFANSGAHREAMQHSSKIAKEIRTITIEATELPDWTKAKELLNEGKVLRY